MTRTRPTMDDYRDAVRYRWMREHVHDLELVEGQWRGYRSRSQLLPTIQSHDLTYVIDHMRPLFREPPAPAVEPAVAQPVDSRSSSRGQDG